MLPDSLRSVDLDDVGALGLRDRKKLLVRESIVNAALELFSADGFDRTTVQAIADRAGVSPATVARYFPSKESLLFANGDLGASTLHESIVGRPADEPPAQAVVAALRERFQLSDERRDRLLRSQRAVDQSPVLRGRAQEVVDHWRDAMATALVERGEPEPRARVLATAIAAVMVDVTARWAAGGGRQDFAELVCDAIAALEESVRVNA